MKSALTASVLVFTCTALTPFAPDVEGAVAQDTDWIPLFDGTTLSGWRANENPGSHQVVDGAIVCVGPRSHLFYSGPVQAARFTDFEFETEVMTDPGANSGVYFHTRFQERDWPTDGFEVQVNNTATGAGGYRENKKTGSLYGIRNVYRQLVPDSTWFRLRIRVEGKRVRTWVNDLPTVDYVEPENAPNGGYAGRRVAAGTFALQCHDPGSRARYRNLRVRALAPSSPPAPALATSPYRISTNLAALHANNFPVLDLHTHLKGGLTLAEVALRQFQTGIGAGIAVNGGLGFPVTNDSGLDRALAEARHPLFFTALQGEGREWPTLFSRDAIARFDYVFTDAMTITGPGGRRMRLWIPEEVTVGDPESFMDSLVAQTVRILKQEPIDVWVNPTFLPAPLAPRHAELWTQARMDQVIAAAVQHGVAIEINDRFQLPGAPFIRAAKKAGLRFTFGTNNGGRDDLGRLDYCVRMVNECGLQWQDLWTPGQQPSRAQRGP
ncbi:MAG: DUF1080 domain-containing protein [Verrucomicrobiales bacterium]|nr:DUF1080 domain-containing protein [Verrucomicrobiales bacterium]